MSAVRTRATGSRIGNGHVTLYSPTDRRPYYRLAYTDRDGLNLRQRQTYTP